MRMWRFCHVQGFRLLHETLGGTRILQRPVRAGSVVGKVCSSRCLFVWKMTSDETLRMLMRGGGREGGFVGFVTINWLRSVSWAGCIHCRSAAVSWAGRSATSTFELRCSARPCWRTECRRPQEISDKWILWFSLFTLHVRAAVASNLQELHKKNLKLVSFHLL